MENPADQHNEQEGDNESGGGGGGMPMEQLQSYLKFAKFVLRKRWLTTVITLVVGIGLTIPLSVYWPRTYSCTTVLMAASSGVLDGRDTPAPLVGAPEIILRHANLEMMVRDIGLIQKFETRRAPLLHLKDRMVRALAGPMTDKMRMTSLVGTLETKIDVTVEKGDLMIKVAWSDPQTAMELAAAARDSFIKARHTAEMSAFEDKMSILDGHGQKLREEIGVLADQLKAVRDQKVGEVREMAAEERKAKVAALAAQERQVVRSAPVSHSIAPDARTPELRANLESVRAKLASAEADRDQRLRAAQAKLDDMKLKLTPSHPEVVAQEQQVAMLAGTPSELALLRAQAKDLEGELRQRDGMAAANGQAPAGAGGRPRTAVDDLLPPDITELLQRDNLDPALTAQLSSTVIKYGALRDDLLTTRIELDTAQAAFNHRYQIIIPAEAPQKPEKPKPGVVFGAGLFLSLILAFLIPILSELRKGVIVERWQVESLQLPVLAELHLPPYSPD
ncbi:MAG: hypothetical protein ABJB12_06690 [Pseudomonadota bacterium]